MTAAESSVSPVSGTRGEPEVRTASGAVRGRRGLDGTAVFRGIPFAAPPVGALRFTAPRPAPAWDGTREAARFGPAAPQALPPSAGGGLPPASPPDDGNWLTLNVWTPDLAAATSGGGLPVLFWIHGGAYMFGSASEPSYDGTVIARLGAVVVSANHRLGVEGFAQVDGAPANRGLLDVVAALGWVAENIARFGGDPASVTVFGESAGAGIIAALLAMPAAKGLFRRAIAQSMPGTFFGPGLAAGITRAIAAEAGVLPTREALAATTPRRLVQAQMAVTAALRRYPQWGPVSLTVTPFSPVVDGDVLPRAPWRALLSGAARDVDLITGYNRDEYRLFIQVGGQSGRITEDDAAEVLAAFAPGPAGAEAYRKAYSHFDAERLYERVFSDWLFRMPSLHLAQAHAASGGRTFLYELAYPAPADPDGLGACHGLDIPLIWGLPGQVEAAGAAAEGLTAMLVGPNPPEEFSALGEVMRREWLTFAAGGNPGWPAYGTERRLTRVYHQPPAVDPYPAETSMHLWERHQFDKLELAPLSHRGLRPPSTPNPPPVPAVDSGCAGQAPPQAPGPGAARRNRACARSLPLAAPRGRHPPQGAVPAYVCNRAVAPPGLRGQLRSCPCPRPRNYAGTAAIPPAQPRSCYR